MWSLYLTAKAMSSRASDLIGIEDRWTALQFDNAVTLVGTVIENASQEQHNVGMKEKPQWVNLYEMSQLLDPAFRLSPPPKLKTEKERNRDAITGLMRLRGVKVFRGRADG